MGSETFTPIPQVNNENTRISFNMSLPAEVQTSTIAVHLEKTTNVYNYISTNDFYHDLMVKHYFHLISR